MLQRRRKARESSWLETIFIDGVNTGSWLGETTSAHNAYQARAYPTASYDDFSHRLDVAVELIFHSPIQSHDGKTILRRATIGIDTTLIGDSTGLREKLTRHYNDPIELPFGFSHLDYYVHEQQREVRPLLPRYVVGLNAYEVKAIWRELKSGQDATAFQSQSATSLRTRFKILMEIRRQNLLYFAMLPEDTTGKMARTAALLIEAVDECLNAALDDCTRQIIAREAVPRIVFAVTRSGKKRRTERERIEDFLISDNRRRYTNQDPFTNIVGEAQRLLDALYASPANNPLRRALEKRRKIMVHNQTLQV